MKPIYEKSYLDSEYSRALFDSLEELEWLSVQSRRKEYFMSDKPTTYQYIDDGYVYNSKPFHLLVYSIMSDINDLLGYDLNVCFLNRYEDKQDSLGWHADDAELIDQSEPIAVVSIGGEREIWWKEQGFKGNIPDENKQLLENGSLFLMPAGFQDKYYHRIPKWDREIPPRISLTYRSIKF